MTNPSPDTSAEAVAKPAAYVVKLNYGSGRWSGDMLTDLLPSDDSRYQIVDRLYTGAQFDTSRAETAAANARADVLKRELDKFRGRYVAEPKVPEFVIWKFEERYSAQFDLARDDHEWRNTWRYKHDHVQSIWEGWRDGYLSLSATGEKT